MQSGSKAPRPGRKKTAQYSTVAIVWVTPRSALGEPRKIRLREGNGLPSALSFVPKPLQT